MAKTSIGYARVSTGDQDLGVQVEALKAAGCSVIRSEKQSGASRDGRAELDTVLQFLRAGDEVVVVRLDRLGRDTRDVLNLVHEIKEKGATLRVLSPAIDTSGPLGEVVLTVLGMVAQMERTFIKERQAAGIASAKQRGAYKGGTAKFPVDEVLRLKEQGMGMTAIAEKFGVTRQAVYKALRERSVNL